MQGEFYIVQHKEDWYSLRVKETHYCISCGSSIDTLLTVVHRYVRQFRTAERMYRALSRLTDGGKCARKEYEHYSLLYLTGENIVHTQEVRDTISRAIQENRQDTPYNNTKKKVKTTPIKRTTSPAPSTQEDTPMKTCGKKIRPLKVKRTI
jgi:hypothetical protein